MILYACGINILLGHKKRQHRAAYAALLAHLTDIGNPEACYMTGMKEVFSKGKPEARPCIVELASATEHGHNVAAYVAAIVLFRANTSTDDNQAARRYMRQVESEEEAAAGAAGGTGGSMFSNEGCLHCCELASCPNSSQTPS